jgi:hypothetical protein
VINGGHSPVIDLLGVIGIAGRVAFYLLFKKVLA